MAYDARTVANEFIKTAQASGKLLTNMQLQKLVYIAHGYSLAILHRPLLRQPVEAWRYGPVIPVLYDALRQYGAGYVTEPINFLPSETLSDTDRALVATVATAYSRFSGPQLATMTHKNGTPWHEVYDAQEFFHNTDIPDALIEQHYTALLNERAGIQAPA